MKNQLVIIGDTNTGKTQLIHHHCSYNYDPTPTIGAEYVFRLKSDWLSACWDMSGHQRYKDIHPFYYHYAQGIVVVFDLTNRASFSHVEHYVNDAQRHAMKNPFIILVGNKSDLHKQREISQDEIDALTIKLQAEAHNIIAYVQTSALTGDGVDELFRYIKKAFTKNSSRFEHSFFAKSNVVNMPADITDEEMADIYLANRSDSDQARGHR
ncbi:Rab family GTPase [Legionella sp. 29fVS95]|uniref:Rab family GTPase n=1 Tax=Legionella sp. 29fVS95 TaxID=3402813 RepID=UPI003AF5FDDB